MSSSEDEDAASSESAKGMRNMRPGAVRCRSAVDQRIREYLERPEGPVPPDLVRRLEALPVYADMGGVLLLTPDGRVLRLPHEPADAPAVEADPQWSLVALVRAAEAYPELAVLLPVRDAASEECAECGGSGRLDVGATQFLCGACQGLGWRLEGQL